MSTDIENLAKLDAVISDAAEALKVEDERTDIYETVLGRVERLYKLRKAITPEPPQVQEVVVDKDRVRFKDFIPVIGSVGGILVIVAFEAFGHTLTSKATAFVQKSK
jgi:hypothetical protein